MNKNLRWIVLIVFALILISCNPAYPPEQKNGLDTELPLITLISTDSTIFQSTAETDDIFIPTLTPLSTEQPTPTYTRTVRLISLPTAITTPTWTPLPTLPPDQAQAFALEMMTTNGGCELPCWLGITPGKITWNEAHAFLATFADEINSKKNMNGVMFKFPDLTKHGAILYNNQEGVVIQISSWDDIPLPDLLTTYGVPSEIWIHAIGVYTLSPVGRFTLVIFYQDQGIMAVYDGENERSNLIHICPSNIHELEHNWLFWSPTEKLTFSEAGMKTLFPYSPEIEEKYISFESLTGLDVKSFYERYKDPANQDICMYVQAPDWP